MFRHLQRRFIQPLYIVRHFQTTSKQLRWKDRDPLPLGTAQPIDTSNKNLTFKQKVLVGLAKLLGYNLPSSLAIRASRDLYTHCALAAENKAFYVDVCGLPDNFHTWFAITQLHVWMLMVRLRPEKHGKAYTQELVNRFFEDVEERIRSHGIIQDRIVAATVKDHLMAFRGGVLAYDEGMCKTDAVLAAALWRNVCRDTPFDKELAYLVRHVRHQLVALDRWPSERLLRGDIKFMTPVAQF